MPTSPMKLDIATGGYWLRCAMGFFDVRIFNPFAKSYRNQPLTIIRTSWKRKENANTTNESFTPLVFSTYVGTGRETLSKYTNKPFSWPVRRQYKHSCKLCSNEYFVCPDTDLDKPVSVDQGLVDLWWRWIWTILYWLTFTK